MQDKCYVSISRCSKRILIPRKIRMIPPASSAFALYLAPNTFPTLTPAMDKKKVVMPIVAAAMVMFTFKNAKVIRRYTIKILSAFYSQSFFQCVILILVGNITWEKEDNNGYQANSYGFVCPK